MSFLFWLLILISGVFVLGYLRTPLIANTLAMAFFIAVITVSGDQPVNSFLLGLIWSVFAFVAVTLNIPMIRRKLISDRILALFRTVTPTMSRTEKEALEAGTVWWDGDLFSGKPDWNKLLKIPAPRLTERERDFIDGPVEDLCKMLDDWKITHEDYDLPTEVWQFIKDNGFFSMIIPRQYGGLEFSALAHSSVVMKIASRSISAAVTVMVPNSLGPAELLLHYGTDEQKEYYLPRLATGEEVPCFALTGPEAGSDASAMPDKGIVCHGEFEGKQVLGIRLNWEKRYITLGPVATVLGLAFKLYDPDHLLGDDEAPGITCALIPTDIPGIKIGDRHMPLNMAFMNGPNYGKDVFIPIDWVIGGKAGVGNGWSMLMESLAAGRSISLPALSTGAGKLTSRATGAYARIRKQFKTPIGKFEGIEEALARIAGFTYMMDAVRVMTAGAVDAGEKPAVVSAIAKFNLTETMRRVVNDAMDIHGGSGICMGPHNFLGRVYQAVPISITVEGANILTRSLIIYGQGAIRCHPYVVKEMQAAKDSNVISASIEFDKALFGHIGFFISNLSRSFLLGLTRGRIATSPVNDSLSLYYKQLTHMSAAFAFVSDVAMMVLGGKLKRKERLSARLADIFSQLYIASCLLKHYEDQGALDEDLPLVQWGCDMALNIIQHRLGEIFRNFPISWVGKLMRLVIFPTGKYFKTPGDRLDHDLATLLLSPSLTRDRLTDGIFVSDNPEDAVGRLETALSKVIESDLVEKKINNAVKTGTLKEGPQESLLKEAVILGIISQQELDVLHDGLVARKNAIKVDAFEQLQTAIQQQNWSKAQ
ncbi:MAG: acyl-CoA dehydrogenase [Gammaproteobacteria bacterium]|nr:acyl-CoA dehydrogenase [Gammaproteobacteria bacterium]